MGNIERRKTSRSNAIKANEIEKLRSLTRPSNVVILKNSRQTTPRRYTVSGLKPSPAVVASVYSTPSWFTSKSPVDVSIIVPLFKSKEVIQKQIEQWDLSDDGLIKEIIYVDDWCPMNSKMIVMESWGKRKSELSGPVGKIVFHKRNKGYGVACNSGAKHAEGKYLVFLNADCVITPNWVKPMIELLESDPAIGMVGNLQTKNGIVDSAGSKWSWDSGSFRHLGKGIPFEEMPEELNVPAEREMVTGCCFAIAKNLFMDLEGFDPVYQTGYWEDADLCMRLRSNGYKIYYQPASHIEHEVGHSHGHANAGKNRAEFHKRWVGSNRINNLVSPSNEIKRKTKKEKVYGCVIACNEEEFLEVSVDSIAPVVDEWLFVIGGNNFAYDAGMCDKKGYPIDNTFEIAKKLASKYGGRVIGPPNRCWLNKVEMRASYAAYLKPGNIMFMLDGDEVYKPDKLGRVMQLMQQYDVLHLQYWVFWNDMNTIGTGSWRNYPQERLVRWKEGFGYYTDHLNVQHKNKNRIFSSSRFWGGEENMFYHYSWVRPIEKIRQKLMYYKNQTKSGQLNYVDDIFLKWRQDRNIPYTHPLGQGGWAPFPGVHPPTVQKMIDDGRLKF